MQGDSNRVVLKFAEECIFYSMNITNEFLVPSFGSAETLNCNECTIEALFCELDTTWNMPNTFRHCTAGCRGILRSKKRICTRSMLKATSQKPVQDLRKYNEVLLVYPPKSNDSVVVTAADFELLSPTRLLNDTLIEFYLRYLAGNMGAERDRFHFFNTFFFQHFEGVRTSLKNGQRQYVVETLKQSILQVDIFSKDFLIVPCPRNCKLQNLLIYNQL